jgi:hypothetical protein
MRFNTKTKGKDTTVNAEGEVAYKLNSEMELYSTVCTAILQNKFYEDKDKTIDRLRVLIKKCSPEFVAKLAIYCREKMYLRSVPLVMAVELAKVHNKDSLVSNTVARIVQRADEITELLSYYALANPKNSKEIKGQTKKLGKLSKQIQKGLAKTFNTFEEYSFSKYNREGDVSLKDALFLVHPKAKNKEQQVIFDKIVKDMLETAYTWETQLSELGQQKFVTPEARQKAMKAKWEELIDSNKMGFMSVLRNLRNILNNNVSDNHIKRVCEYLSNEKAVLGSRQLPFRFLSAYRMLSNDSPTIGYVLHSRKLKPTFNSPVLLDALEEALVISTKNIKVNDEERILIACDVSGSMNTPISPKSIIQNYDIGMLLGCLLQSKCKKVITGVFGDIFKTVTLPKKGILQNWDKLYKLSTNAGWSTNGWKVIEYLNKEKLKVDKVMIFTDCQLWDSSKDNNFFFRNDNSSTMIKEWTKYKKFSPTTELYLFDLAGYGNTPIKVNENDVYLIAGWSEKIFDALEAIKNGKSVLDEIKKIELGG